MNNYSQAVPASLPVAVPVAVVGASGYAGQELVARLGRHAGARLAATLASGREPDPGALLGTGAAVVFLATPPESSLEWTPALVAGGARVIDLSGAFRLADAALYARVYGHPHSAPELLREAVYGWPEQNRARIPAARLIANPGCYATAAATALWPLLARGVIEPHDIVCDAKSGASGAGRGLRQDLHFVELEGNCKAYSPLRHRHAPEIAQTCGLPLEELSFTPHLLPTSRGILATNYVRLRNINGGGGADEIESAYRAAYEGHPFVRLTGAELPELRQVNYTNECRLGWAVEPGARRAVVVSCLDNLVKGAAGQAIQNFNLMTGQPETAGLA